MWRTSVSQGAEQFNAASGATLTYTSKVPFTLTQTLVIKNSQGVIVRTLFDGQRLAGTYSDAWNGRNDQNTLVPDGPYFYSSTVTASGSTMTWDKTGEFINDAPDAHIPVGPILTYDPFNNTPLTYIYSLPYPARISITYYVNFEDLNCATDFCEVIDKYERSGSLSGVWAGVDGSGVLRPDLSRIDIFRKRSNFSKNAVVLYGGRPTISNLKVTPPFYKPTSGNQILTFDLTTYQSQTASVSITYQNQSTLSILRTITSNGVEAGEVSIPWDGKADNGTDVAPGYYTVTVSVNDALGNEVRAQMLTTIRY